MALSSKVEAADQQFSRFTALLGSRREMEELKLIADSNKIHSQVLTMFQSFQYERQRNREDDKETELLHCLASDYRSDKDFVSNRIDDTCDWFFGDKRYIDWCDSSETSLLWVSAGPGMG